MFLESILLGSRTTYVNPRKWTEVHNLKILLPLHLRGDIDIPGSALMMYNIQSYSYTIFDDSTRCHARRSSQCPARPSCPLACACYHSGGPAPLVCQALFCTRSCRIVVESSVWSPESSDPVATSARGNSPSARR